jgi:hypothetical protein
VRVGCGLWSGLGVERNGMVEIPFALVWYGMVWHGMVLHFAPSPFSSLDTAGSYFPLFACVAFASLSCTIPP